eukprot:30568_2
MILGCVHRGNKHGCVREGEKAFGLAHCRSNHTRHRNRWQVCSFQVHRTASESFKLL